MTVADVSVAFEHWSVVERSGTDTGMHVGVLTCELDGLSPGATRGPDFE